MLMIGLGIKWFRLENARKPSGMVNIVSRMSGKSIELHTVRMCDGHGRNRWKLVKIILHSTRLSPSLGRICQCVRADWRERKMCRVRHLYGARAVFMHWVTIATSIIRLHRIERSFIPSEDHSSQVIVFAGSAVLVLRATYSIFELKWKSMRESFTLPSISICVIGLCAAHGTNNLERTQRHTKSAYEDFAFASCTSPTREPA